LFGLDISGANKVGYYEQGEEYGFANANGDVFIHPRAFQSIADLAGTIWHELGHIAEQNSPERKETSFTNHVAIYEKERSLQRIFGNFSQQYLNDLKRELEGNRSDAKFDEPELYQSYLDGNFGGDDNCYCAEFLDDSI